MKFVDFSGRIISSGFRQVLSPLTSELAMFALAALVYCVASRTLVVPKKKSGPTTGR